LGHSSRQTPIITISTALQYYLIKKRHRKEVTYLNVEVGEPESGGKHCFLLTECTKPPRTDGFMAIGWNTLLRFLGWSQKTLKKENN